VTNVWLPSAVWTSDWSDHQTTFVHVLATMLNEEEPDLLDRAATDAALGEDGVLRFRLAHAARSDWNVEGSLGGDRLVVRVWDEVENLPLRKYQDDVAEWITQGVAFIRQAIVGGMEIVHTYRGGHLSRIETYLRGQSGETFRFSSSSVLHVPVGHRRVERTRITFRSDAAAPT